MNVFKTVILLTALTLLLIFIGQLVAGPAGALVAFIIALLMNLVSFWFSDKIVIGMYRGREILPSDEPRIHRMVSNLSQAANIPKPRIYLIPLNIPNAFATGRDPKHASLALTEGILRTLNEEELEGVISHEIAHIKNRDILIGTIAATLAGAIMTIAYWARWIAFLGSGDEDRGGIGLIGILLLSILAPLAATIVQMAISRTREYQADETGAHLSGKPLALANALEKLEMVARRSPLGGGSPATSHLFIVNPFRGDFLFRLFSTHPPIEERIRRLRALAGIA
ncbi:protease HtpX [Candidatus Aerophobetes bacterium]|uniref:Protease HtpX homolog n=1 Tax=Aerophobetes bacterium TaxID=2030807 RepID=A0A497E660_UNCAE|nr:MAG: protease HtpX [Candidatus Aerophobetes bacterium]